MLSNDPKKPARNSKLWEFRLTETQPEAEHKPQQTINISDIKQIIDHHNGWCCSRWGMRGMRKLWDTTPARTPRDLLVNLLCVAQAGCRRIYRKCGQCYQGALFLRLECQKCQFYSLLVRFVSDRDKPEWCVCCLWQSRNVHF